MSRVQLRQVRDPACPYMPRGSRLIISRTRSVTFDDEDFEHVRGIVVAVPLEIEDLKLGDTVIAPRYSGHVLTKQVKDSLVTELIVLDDSSVIAVEIREHATP